MKSTSIITLILMVTFTLTVLGDHIEEKSMAEVFSKVEQFDGNTGAFEIERVQYKRIAIKKEIIIDGSCTTGDDCSDSEKVLKRKAVIQVKVSYYVEDGEASDTKITRFNFALNSISAKTLKKLKKNARLPWWRVFKRLKSKRVEKRMARRLFKLQITKEERVETVIDDVNSYTCDADDNHCSDEDEIIKYKKQKANYKMVKISRKIVL